MPALCWDRGWDKEVHVVWPPEQETTEFRKAYCDLSRSYEFPNPGKRPSFIIFNISHCISFPVTTPSCPHQRKPNQIQYLMDFHKSWCMWQGEKEMLILKMPISTVILFLMPIHIIPFFQNYAKNLHPFTFLPSPRPEGHPSPHPLA